MDSHAEHAGGQTASQTAPSAASPGRKFRPPRMLRTGIRIGTSLVPVVLGRCRRSGRAHTTRATEVARPKSQSCVNWSRAGPRPPASGVIDRDHPPRPHPSRNRHARSDPRPVATRPPIRRRSPGHELRRGIPLRDYRAEPCGPWRSRSAVPGGTRGGVVPRDSGSGALGRSKWRAWTDLRRPGWAVRHNRRGLSQRSLAAQPSLTPKPARSRAAFEQSGSSRRRP